MRRGGGQCDAGSAEQAGGEEEGAGRGHAAVSSAAAASRRAGGSGRGAETALTSPMISAVLFDLDQTLLDRKSSLAGFLRDQFARFGDALGNTGLDAWLSRFLALDAHGLVNKSVVYPQILRDFGGDPAISNAMTEDYLRRFCTFARGFPAMNGTLLSLRAHGLKLGIVTNGESAFQQRSIDALGLSALVDEVLISETEGLRKPDAQLFRRAAQRLGAPPSGCLFVGDNPVADVLGAHAAGMRTAWFGPGLEWPEDIASMPGAKIDTLPQVLGLAGIRDDEG
jgi:putative hydrolase of the HAD superfamily